MSRSMLFAVVAVLFVVCAGILIFAFNDVPNENVNDDVWIASTPDAAIEQPEMASEVFQNPKEEKIYDVALSADFEVVRSSQLQRLIDLGFQKAAGMSESEFRLLVPEAPSEDALLVVNETLVPLAKQCELLGVSVPDWIDLTANHVNLISVPDKPLYWRTGLKSGKETLGMSVVSALQWMEKNNRRPASTSEVLAIYCQFPDFLKSHNMDAAGSGYANGTNPYLCLQDRESKNKYPFLGVALSTNKHELWGSPSFKE